MGLSQAPGTTQTSAVGRGVSERIVQGTGEQTGTKQAQRMSGDRSIQTAGRVVGDSLAFDFSSLL
jgi:hypothetical protein